MMMMALNCQAQKMSKYLFAYFTGNDPKEEQICFAVSDDGFSGGERHHSPSQGRARPAHTEV